MSGEIHFYTLAKASELLNYEIAKLDIKLLKRGCEITKIPFIGGGTFIISRSDDPIEEELALKRAVEKDIWHKTECIMVGAKLDKNHPRFSYYSVIVIRSENLMDLKMALKVHKLKAFL